MAIVMTIHCPSCGQTKREARNNDDYTRECGECQSKAANFKRTEVLAGLQALPVEERLSRIEAWIYDYRPPVDPRSIRF